MITLERVEELRKGVNKLSHESPWVRSHGWFPDEFWADLLAILNEYADKLRATPFPRDLKGDMAAIPEWTSPGSISRDDGRALQIVDNIEDIYLGVFKAHTIGSAEDFAYLKARLQQPRVTRFALMEKLKWWAVSPDSALLDEVIAMLRELGIAVEDERGTLKAEVESRLVIGQATVKKLEGWSERALKAEADLRDAYAFIKKTEQELTDERKKKAQAEAALAVASTSAHTWHETATRLADELAAARPLLDEAQSPSDADGLELVERAKAYRAGREKQRRENE